MKYIIFISLFWLTGFSMNAQMTFTTVDSQTVSTSLLNEKKTVVVILPTESDTALLYQLVNFQERYGDSVKLIGLVCLINCNESANSINAMYTVAIAAGVIIPTDISNADDNIERESVLKWLSERSMNNRSAEPGIIGKKYFLSKEGRLYAQLGANERLDSKLAENIIRTQVPGDN